MQALHMASRSSGDRSSPFRRSARIRRYREEQSPVSVQNTSQEVGRVRRNKRIWEEVGEEEEGIEERLYTRIEREMDFVEEGVEETLSHLKEEEDHHHFRLEGTIQNQFTEFKKRLEEEYDKRDAFTRAMKDR